MGNTNSPQTKNETPDLSLNKNNCKICDTSLLHKVYLGFNIISLILPYIVNLSLCRAQSNLQVNSYVSSTNLRMLCELNTTAALLASKPSNVLMTKRTKTMFDSITTCYSTGTLKSICKKVVRFSAY